MIECSDNTACSSVIAVAAGQSRARPRVPPVAPRPATGAVSLLFGLSEVSGVKCVEPIRREMIVFASSGLKWGIHFGTCRTRVLRFTSNASLRT